MTHLSAEVTEAVRLRDAADINRDQTADDYLAALGELNAAAPSHVDLIERLHSELVKYVGIDSANVQYQIHQGNEMQALQEENARLHARVRELEGEVAIWQHEYDERK